MTVTDSLVVTMWAGEREARMPIAGDAIPINVRGRRIEAKAKWDGGRLRLERRIDGGGMIVDLVEPLAEGRRLLVTRTVKGLPGTIPEIRLVFDREGGVTRMARSGAQISMGVRTGLSSSEATKSEAGMAGISALAPHLSGIPRLRWRGHPSARIQRLGRFD